MVRSGQSLLRQASILVTVSCVGLGAPGFALAQSPAPDPAPPRTTEPKPEPEPRTKPRVPAQPPVTATQTSTTPRSRAQAVQPPVLPPPAFLPQPAPVAPPPPAATVQKPAVVKKKSARARATKQSTRRKLPRARPAVAKHSSAPDTMLLAGGLALVVLILGDALFLAFSVRVLREAG